MTSPPAADPGTTAGLGISRELTIAAIAAVPLLLLAWRFDFLCDDAYISFRYARHLAEGAGLRFNPGETPPVEGFTNLLWVLLMSLAAKLGGSMEVASRLASLACGLGLVMLVVRFLSRRAGFAPPTILAAALFLATLPPVALWCTSGLETMAFALACFAAFERMCGDPERPHGIAAGLAAAAAALLRADGAAWAAVVLAAAWLGGPRFPTRERRRAAFAAAAILLVAVGANVDWRLDYFGEWLPNSAYVKAGFSEMRLERGAKYVLGLALAVPTLAIVPVTVLLQRGRAAPALALRAGAVVLCAVLAATYVGGDFMPMGRMTIVAMPFVAILFAVALESIARPAARWAFAAASVVVGVLAACGVDFVPHPVLQSVHHRWNLERAPTETEVWEGMKARAIEWKRLGRALRLHTKPGELIILGAVGAVGFETELVIYDQFGIVTPAVARRDAPPERRSAGHDKGVPPAFFLDRHPTYWNAVLAPAGSPPETGLPPGWAQTAQGARIEIERRALPEDEFGPGLELRLLRLR